MNINSRIKQLLKTSLVAIVVMTSGLSAMAQTFDASNITFGGINMPYRVAHTIGMGEPLLVIYLHGGTSKGNDNERQMGEPGIDSIANYIKQQQMEAYFLVPQCPSDKSWGGPMLSVLKALIDKYVKEGVADKNSVYIFGGSMGGTGTWSMLSAYPGMFAAAMPVAGNPSKCDADKVASTPVYTVMGTSDQIMNVETTADFIDELNARDGKTKFDIEDGWTHKMTCIQSYTTQRLDWVFSQSISSSGIEKPTTEGKDIISMQYYATDGRRLAKPTSKGLNIMRCVYEDGTVKAVKRSR